MRKKKLIWNTLVNLAYQAISVICGFLIPKAILLRYGSLVNGLVNSSAQFLGFISLLESGMSAVANASLYTPLANKDYVMVNKIFISAQKFFRKLALVFIVYVLLLAVIYPVTVKADFSYYYCMLLIIIMAVNIFVQYYFGLSHIIILNADQRSYTVKLIQIAAIILNAMLTLLFVKLGCSIHFVKLMSASAFAIQPILLTAYNKKRYHLDDKAVIFEEPIKQKWNGLAQHIAFTVTTRTDTIILTFFSTLENVSVYGVYNMINTGVVDLFNIMTNGVSPLLGNMLAKHETELLNNFFEAYECFAHAVTTFLFTMTGMLIVPFTAIYTKGVTDADYIVPQFAAVLTIAYAIRALRTPYNSLVMSAGHFRQTQLSAIIEAVINISVSLILVMKYGLAGVAAGTVVAMIYRTIYLAVYVSNNILYRNVFSFIKYIAVDFMSAVIILWVSRSIYIPVYSYSGWFSLALKFGIIAFIVTILMYVLFNYKAVIKIAGLIRIK